MQRKPLRQGRQTIGKQVRHTSYQVDQGQHRCLSAGFVRKLSEARGNGIINEPF